MTNNALPFEKKNLKQSSAIVFKSDKKNPDAELFKNVVDLTHVVIRDHKSPSHIIKKCFKKLLFNQSKKLEKLDANSKRTWIAYCLDLSVLLNAFSIVLLFLSKKTLEISQDYVSDDSSESLSEDIYNDLNETIADCDGAGQNDHADSNALDDPVSKKVFSILESILNDEKNVLMGLQLTQFLSLFFLKKLKKK